MTEDSSKNLLLKNRHTQIILSITYIFNFYFRGLITNISKNTKFDKKEFTFSVVDKEKHIVSSIEGEFTNYLKFDGETYWEYQKDVFPAMKRMAFTLPSDSTFREDLIWLKQNDEDTSQKLKIKLEEIQRNDKKLREAHVKEEEKNKKKK